MGDLEKNVKEVIYDCCHSLSQPSMQGMMWGEIKDYLTRHIIAILPQWQDISTAPRDGTEIDILLNGNGAARIPNVKWGDDGVNHTWIDSYDNPVIHEGDPMNEITHWMPYPLPPEET